MGLPNFCCQLAGPITATLILLSALFPITLASSGVLLNHCPADVTPDVTRPDEAVSERKVVYDVSVRDGTRFNLAVFVYELDVLIGDRRQGEPHLSKGCKKNRETAVVLLHGATYNHKYWDAPQSVDGFPHSLARYLAKLCYLVVAPDMLGVGESDKPDGRTTGIPDQGHATSQVLRSLKMNNNPVRKHKAKKIVLIGHSLGSQMADLILGTDSSLADAYVPTGWTNGYEPNLNGAGFKALLDAVGTSPGGYIATPPATHAGFYLGVEPMTGAVPSPHPATWSDAMLAYDISNLGDSVTYQNGYVDTLTLVNSRSSNTANDPSFIFDFRHTDQITVPVLMLCGDNDALASANGCARDGIYYPNSPSVTSFVQPNIGHVYNLHQNAVTGWEKVVDFIETHT